MKRPSAVARNRLSQSGRIVVDRLDLGAAGVELAGAPVGELRQLLVQLAQPALAVAQRRLGRFDDLAAAGAVDRNPEHRRRTAGLRRASRLPRKHDPVDRAVRPDNPVFDPHRPGPAGKIPRAGKRRARGPRDAPARAAARGRPARPPGSVGAPVEPGHRPKLRNICADQSMRPVARSHSQVPIPPASCARRKCSFARPDRCPAAPSLSDAENLPSRSQSLSRAGSFGPARRRAAAKPPTLRRSRRETNAPAC